MLYQGFGSEPSPTIERKVSGKKLRGIRWPKSASHYPSVSLFHLQDDRAQTDTASDGKDPEYPPPAQGV
jgi:hypothetical protein